jgi:hypothetical protein
MDVGVHVGKTEQEASGVELNRFCSSQSVMESHPSPMALVMPVNGNQGCVLRSGRQCPGHYQSNLVTPV